MTSFELRLEKLRLDVSELAEAMNEATSSRATQPTIVTESDVAAVPPTTKQNSLAARLRDDLLGRQDDEATAVAVKVLCDFTRPSARCIAEIDRVHPDWRKAEIKLYAERTREAVALAEAIRDDSLHDQALEHIIALCVEARDDVESHRLLQAVRTEFVRQRIVTKHPSIDGRVGAGRDHTGPSNMKR